MQEVTTQQEIDALAAQGPVVVKFSAAWCGPCRQLTPVVEQLAENNSNVSFVSVDTDTATELAASHNINAIPCIKLYKDQAVVETVFGLVSEQELQSKIDLLTE